MTLDRATPPQTWRLDSRTFCDRCGDVVAHLTDGLCPYCHDRPQEDPMTSVEELTAAELAVTTILPEYAVDIAELLAETEGHADVTVRAVRKIVVQGAIALRALLATPQTSAPDAPATTTALPPMESSSAEAPSGSEPTAAEYRTWALTNGHAVAANGRVPQYIKDLYASAHRDAA